MELRGRVVEVEAYAGPADLAAHSAGGRRTARVASMWGRAGLGYVYFTYGMHHCFNVVAGGEGEPEAVLIRALEPEAGSVAGMRVLRESACGRAVERDRDLCSGPAKLCQSLAIDRGLDGVDLLAGGVGSGAGLWLERGSLGGEMEVASGPRIGLSERAGAWRDRAWRWWLSGNEHVSR